MKYAPRKPGQQGLIGRLFYRPREHSVQPPAGSLVWLQIFALPLFILLGIVLVSKFQSVQKVGGSVSLQRTQELTSRVQLLQEENGNLQKLINEQRQRILEYEASVHDVDGMQQRLTEDLQQLRMEAGLVDMQGPGIVISVSLRKYEAGFIIKNVVDEDLLMIVNELNASAAEAISINGERFTSSTEIRNAGNYININTRACAAPFTIQVIGNPETLEAALRLRGGIVETLSEYYDITIERQESLVIPKYNGILAYRYAQPVTEGM